ncbi:MAG: hypothetical protein ABJE95_13665 [Byssovorax sp.]
MKPFAPIVLSCVVAGSAVALAACLVDLSNLSGGTLDGGASGGASSSGSTTAAATSGDGSSTTGAGAGGATSTAASSSSASGSGAGGMMIAGCPGAVLDCSGCACPAGGCAAVPLATGNDANSPRNITTSSEGVFWSDTVDGQIMGILANETTPQVIVKASKPTALAAAAGRLVFAAQDGLWTCLLPACDATKSHLAGSIAPGSVQSVAYDGQLAYWADRGDGVNTGNGEIQRCDPATDCSAPVLIADQQLLAKGLFLTANSLFWMAQGNGQSNGSIHKSPRTAAGETVITAALVLPTGLAADDTYVYWTQGTASGAVLRCDHTQGYCQTPVNVAQKAGALGLPLDLAIAGGRLYWNENGKGTISSCPLPGCGAAESPRVHATGRQGVHRIAVGSTCLLWTDDVNGGTVDKVGR